MATRSNSSRERILACAEAIILQKGFSGTSIDDILEKAAITKGGFFYHFEGKNELAKSLVERYLRHDDELFGELFAQAESLTENPLQQLLIFLKLFADKMGQMEQVHPGCLVASFTYESYQFDDDIRELIKSGLDRWRSMIRTRLEPIMALYPPKQEISPTVLADMFSSTIEGGIIISRAMQDKQLLVDQVLMYRNVIRNLFET